MVTPADLDALDAAIPALSPGSCDCCMSGGCDDCSCVDEVIQLGRHRWHTAAPDLIAEVRRLHTELSDARIGLEFNQGRFAAITIRSLGLEAEVRRLTDTAAGFRDTNTALHSALTVAHAEIDRLLTEVERLTTEMNRALAEAEMAQHDADMAEERGFRAGYRLGMSDDAHEDQMNYAWEDYQREKGGA